MDRELKVGDAIVWVDEHRQTHNALVTKIWPGMGGQATGCNLVFVDGNEAKEDQYGRQIGRQTSVCHLSVQSAKAWCWMWPDEQL